MYFNGFDIWYNFRTVKSNWFDFQIIENSQKFTLFKERKTPLKPILKPYKIAQRSQIGPIKG